MDTEHGHVISQGQLFMDNTHFYTPIFILDVFVRCVVFIEEKKRKQVEVMAEEWKEYFDKRLGDFKEESR